MKTIPLTRGYEAIVDDEDYEALQTFKWRLIATRRTRYAVANARDDNGKRVLLYMHRLLASPGPGQQVDHIDGNGLNNTRANLRLCTSTENHGNQRKLRNSTSRFKGVSWSKRHRKWVAMIGFNGAQVNLGVYADEEDAAIAYNVAAQLCHGQFALLNPV